jgi:hypothetical protein
MKHKGMYICTIIGQNWELWGAVETDAILGEKLKREKSERKTEIETI